MSEPRRLRYGQPASPALCDSVDSLLADWAVQRPDLDFSPVGIVTRLERVRAYLDSSLVQFFAQHGLTAADFRVIVGLRRSGVPFRLPQSRLTTQLGLTSGTISVRLDRLERAEIVTREVDPDDKRGALVTLAPRGVALFDEMAPAHLANEDRLLSALTDVERDTLAALLRRLLVPFERAGTGGGRALGATIESATLARQRRTDLGLSDTPGLLVADVTDPALACGLRRGDLLIAIDGEPVRSEVALAEAIQAAGRGGMVHLSVLRGDEPRQLQVGPIHD